MQEIGAIPVPHIQSMPSLTRPSPRGAGVLVASLALCVAVALVPSRVAAARTQTIDRLRHQIAASQNQINDLAGQINAASSRLDQLNASVGDLKGAIAGIQSNLDTERAELLAVRAESGTASGRLSQLEGHEARAERVLTAQLINSYESNRPDLVDVVLEASGFQDLLEQLNFDERIQNQDARVVGQVVSARRAVAAQATRLGQLEQRAQMIATRVLRQRNALSRARLNLEREEQAVAELRQEKAGRLAGTRSQVVALRQQLASARAAAAPAPSQTTVTTAAGATSTPTSSSSPPSSSAASSSDFVFPLPKSAASPPSTWSPDEGVDIAAPGNTPEYAVCSGTIVLHGIGGFGPWAPVLHCDNAIDGYSYVYYGHAGPENQLPVGTHVGAGRAMSSIGPGIVGISTGPHLEIGFADSSGSPIGSQTAGTMLSLLQAAYNS
jgi:murein DD-endopeptidase MepM/ murein hydrolase activator NlpD